MTFTKFPAVLFVKLNNLIKNLTGIAGVKNRQDTYKEDERGVPLTTGTENYKVIIIKRACYFPYY